MGFLQMEIIYNFYDNYLKGFTFPSLDVVDIIEMAIIAFAIYEIIVWVKNTRAWMLVKGIIFLLAFSIIAMILQMDVILWIFKNAINVGIIAIVIVFQPELRSALEQIGRKKLFFNMISFDDQDNISRLSEESINSLVKASFEMGRTKTGALIVIENEIQLKDIERSGIRIDGEISSQLLVNTFEHNTPLHDGAVLIRNNRILAATCYLPLSDNMELSKELGTRHRAAVGISEVSDSFTIIVSEETGVVSFAYNGSITRDLNPETLKNHMQRVVGRTSRSKKGVFRNRKEKEVQDEYEEEDDD